MLIRHLIKMVYIFKRTIHAYVSNFNSFFSEITFEHTLMDVDINNNYSGHSRKTQMIT